jgi:hypothetical protein
MIDLVEILGQEEIAANDTEKDAEDGAALFDDLCRLRSFEKS